MIIKDVKSDTYEHEIVKNYLVENEDSHCKVLDLGCEVPIALFDLDIVFSIDKFHGIDILPNELQLIKRYWYLMGIQSEIKFKTIKECYKNYLNNNRVEKGLTQTTMKNKIENYEKRYTIQTGINCLDLTDKKIVDFDILFGIGLLHFLKYKDVLEFVKVIPDFIKNNGIVVITANHEQNSSMNDETYSEKLGRRNFRQKELNEIVYLFDDNGFLKVVESLEEHGIQRLVFEKYKNSNTQTFEDYLYIGKKNIS